MIDVTRLSVIGGAAVSGLIVLSSKTVFGSEANSANPSGIIGTGVRGSYDGQLQEGTTLGKPVRAAVQ